MATNTSTSACITSTSLPHTQGNIKRSIDICDASFSSYISNAKQINIQKLAESTHSRYTTTTKLQPYQINSHRKLTEDGEISIFDAEKYFNGGMDEEKSRTTETGGVKHQSVKDDRLNLQSIKLNIKPAITTSRSEARLNTQSTSIPGLLKDRSRSGRNKVYGKHFISTFSWKCSCSERKSVDINPTVGKNKNSKNGKKTMKSEGSCVKQLIEHSDHIKRDPPNSIGSIPNNTQASGPCQNFNKSHCGLLKDENFAFTVSKSVVENLATESQCEEVLKKGNRQKSFEVFGSPILDKGDNASGLDSRLTIFAWDVDPRVEDIRAPSDSSILHDNDSDSSSDLFEIKNLPEIVHPFFMRQAIDGMSACLTTSCYEPSEASIDWSAVTAGKTAKAEEMQETQTNGYLGYLGCESQRAHKSVWEQHNVPEEKSRTRKEVIEPGTLTSITEFQTKTESRDFNPPSVQHEPHAHSIPQWHCV